MSISFVERKKTIMELLDREEKVKVPELAELLHVSGETIRRDLDRLEKEGMLRKVYGGAVKEKFHSTELPFEQKTTINEREKRAICQTAAELVEDGDIIMIGHGTTTMEMVYFLADKQDVTLITPSIPILTTAMDVFPGRVIFIGGEMEKAQKLTVGPLAERTLEQLKANKAFIAAGGLSKASGITDYDLNGASISRKMMERSDEVILLADHTKFGKSTFAYINPLTEAAMIVTNQPCSETWEKLLTEHEVGLVIAEHAKKEFFAKSELMEK
ncbi:DeoR/GlpR family DNA-binding transcription regulator [Bacillus piscicola]|uniref:DeoR/GlpR family DNA-binding transcription regulator n=1 Tax=Bacillus piscicola TaxID=1632684 RepID=UPI001F088F50|nr:DeoR/GlpR family DNA-binding transcription regulator [Bacillus piscicola]